MLNDEQLKALEDGYNFLHKEACNPKNSERIREIQSGFSSGFYMAVFSLGYEFQYNPDTDRSEIVKIGG